MVSLVWCCPFCLLCPLTLSLLHFLLLQYPTINLISTLIFPRLPNSLDDRAILLPTNRIFQFLSWMCQNLPEHRKPDRSMEEEIQRNNGIKRQTHKEIEAKSKRIDVLGALKTFICALVSLRAIAPLTLPTSKPVGVTEAVPLKAIPLLP